MNEKIKEKELLEKLRDVQSKILSLNEQKTRLIDELNTLYRNSTSPHSQRPLEASRTSPIEDNSNPELSPDDKINLFRSFFRGREDVHARLWVSKKTGKSGYSPVCKNEWVPKICQKPKIKCAECPNRELLPLDDEAIRKHLMGACVVGIYPMLKDEGCYFLVFDFDGED